MNIFWIFRYFFRCDGQYSKTSWSVLFQNFLIIVRYCRFIHNLQHNFWRSFAIAVTAISHCTVWCNDTHSLNVRIKFKPSENYTFVISFACKWKYNVRIILRKIKFEFTELEKFYLHWISHKLPSWLNLNDWMVRGHITKRRVNMRIFLNYLFR